MSGEEQFFSDVTRKDYGSVTFRDNSKVRVVGIGSVDFVGSTQVEKVLLVESLKHNLLSISQLCDEENVVIFEKNHCIIKSSETKETRFVTQCHKNMYVLQLKELADQDVCLVASKSDQLQLWHRRLGHASTSVIEKLQKLNIIEGLPKLNTQTDAVCEACARGK